MGGQESRSFSVAANRNIETDGVANETGTTGERRGPEKLRRANILGLSAVARPRRRRERRQVFSEFLARVVAYLRCGGDQRAF